MNAFSDLIRPGAAVILCGAAMLLVAGCEGRQAGTPPVPKTSVGTGIDDSLITTKVKSALLADPDIKSLDFKVETRAGEVMLSGFVANQGQLERAVMVAGRVEGVKVVSDKMTIRDGPATVGNKVDDGIITSKVKAALLADPSIKSFDIAVVTQKGKAQLSGFVNDQAQIDRATTLAGSVEGVTSVASEMSIKK